MSARSEVLARIRGALGERRQIPEVPRDYRTAEAATTAALDAEERIELLVDRLVDYKAIVHRCTKAELATTLAAALAGRGSSRMVVPAGVPDHWRVPGVEWLVDDPAQPLTVTDLDAVDGVLTGSAVAIALTGTIVLESGLLCGRRAISLVPDHHLCVVAESDVEHGLPDALARLDDTVALTWISGPSATSDIELNRVEGVHGPRTLEVVIVSEG